MNPNDLFDCVNEVLKLTITGVGGLYLTAIMANRKSYFFSEKIKNQKTLDRVVSEEAKKLDMKNVTGIYTNKDDACIYIRGRIKTVQVGGNLATR